MKGIAEGTYNTKHAEAARLYYTTSHIHTHIHLQSLSSDTLMNVVAIPISKKMTQKLNVSSAVELHF